MKSNNSGLLLGTNLLIAHNHSSPIDVAIVVRITFTYGIDVELDHPPRIFSALVRLALLTDSKCHTCDSRDRGDG